MLGWPQDLCTYFQQCGRAARLEDQISIAVLVADVSSFVSIVISIYSTTEQTNLDDTDNNNNALAGLNSAITPIRHAAKQINKLPKSKSAYNLSSTQQHTLELRSLSEMMDVL